MSGSSIESSQSSESSIVTGDDSCESNRKSKHRNKRNSRSYCKKRPQWHKGDCGRRYRCKKHRPLYNDWSYFDGNRYKHDNLNSYTNKFDNSLINSLHDNTPRSLIHRIICLIFLWPIYIPYVIMRDIIGSSNNIKDMGMYSNYGGRYGQRFEYINDHMDPPYRWWGPCNKMNNYPSSWIEYKDCMKHQHGYR